MLKCMGCGTLAAAGAPVCSRCGAALPIDTTAAVSPPAFGQMSGPSNGPSSVEGALPPPPPFGAAASPSAYWSPPGFSAPSPPAVPVAAPPAVPVAHVVPMAPVVPMAIGVPAVTPMVVMAAPKSKATAAVLCFFFGMLGVHRFYTGQAGIGVAQLLLNVFLFWTLIVPLAVSVWVFIDFIMILTGGVKDQYGRPLV